MRPFRRSWVHESEQGILTCYDAALQIGRSEVTVRFRQPKMLAKRVWSMLHQWAALVDWESLCTVLSRCQSCLPWRMRQPSHGEIPMQIAISTILAVISHSVRDRGFGMAVTELSNTLDPCLSITNSSSVPHTNRAMSEMPYPLLHSFTGGHAG